MLATKCGGLLGTATPCDYMARARQMVLCIRLGWHFVLVAKGYRATAYPAATHPGCSLDQICSRHKYPWLNWPIGLGTLTIAYYRLRL